MFPREEQLRHPPGGPVVMAIDLQFPRADVSLRSIPAIMVSLRLLTSTLGMNSHPTSCSVRDSSKVAIWVQWWVWRQPSCAWLRSLSFGHLEQVCAVWKACCSHPALCRNTIKQQPWRSKDHRAFVTWSSKPRGFDHKYLVSLLYPAFLCCWYQLALKTRPLLNSRVVNKCLKIWQTIPTQHTVFWVFGSLTSSYWWDAISLINTYECLDGNHMTLTHDHDCLVLSSAAHFSHFGLNILFIPTIYTTKFDIWAPQCNFFYQCKF